MTIQLEQIEMLRGKANVGYEEAKKALEDSNGDVLEALIGLEKENKIKMPENDKGVAYSIFGAVKKLFKTCNDIKFVIKKNDVVAINLSLTISILITAFVPPLTIMGIILAMITNHKIRFEKPGVSDMQINKTFDKMTNTVSSISKEMAHVIEKNAQ